MEKGHWYTDENGHHYFVKEGQSPKEGWEATKRRKMIKGGKYQTSEDGENWKDVSRDEYDKYESDSVEFDENVDDDFGFDEEQGINYDAYYEKVASGEEYDSPEHLAKDLMAREGLDKNTARIEAREIWDDVMRNEFGIYDNDEDKDPNLKKLHEGLISKGKEEVDEMIKKGLNDKVILFNIDENEIFKAYTPEEKEQLKAYYNDKVKVDKNEKPKGDDLSEEVDEYSEYNISKYKINKIIEAAKNAKANGQTPQRVLDSVSYDLDIEPGTEEFKMLMNYVKKSFSQSSDKKSQSDDEDILQYSYDLEDLEGQFDVASPQEVANLMGKKVKTPEGDIFSPQKQDNEKETKVPASVRKLIDIINGKGNEVELKDNKLVITNRFNNEKGTFPVSKEQVKKLKELGYLSEEKSQSDNKKPVNPDEEDRLAYKKYWNAQGKSDKDINLDKWDDIIKQSSPVRKDFKEGDEVISSDYGIKTKAKIIRKLSSDEKWDNSFSRNPFAGDYYEIGYDFLGMPQKRIVWAGNLDKHK